MNLLSNLFQKTMITNFNSRNLLKSIILIGFWFGGTNNGFAQELRYDISGKYDRAIKLADLQKAKSLSALSPGFPKSWITTYKSTQISLSGHESMVSARGQNEVLSPDQLDLLGKAETGQSLVVEVFYTYDEGGKKDEVPRKIGFSLSIIPDTEASFPGGYPLLSSLLQEEIVKAVSAMDPQLKKVKMGFTISDAGLILSPEVLESSGNQNIDQFIIQQLSKLPRWNPARLQNGRKVSQDFIFSIGKDGC